jgi:hypothetical protein
MPRPYARDGGQASPARHRPRIAAPALVPGMIAAAGSGTAATGEVGD